MKAILQYCKDRGIKPFRYQREAWKAFIEGESGLIHAPTGFGKTLAAWLGPVQGWIDQNPNYLDLIDASLTKTTKKKTSKKKVSTRAMRDASAPLQVLWITPLRALANDTVKALQTPVEHLRLPWSVELRTGDVSQSRKQAQRRRLPTALVTTPESLTLLLSYPEAQEKFATLEAVIVDEWHELIGTKRGVQTELALARLRAWHPGLSVWGLSATLGNLEEARDVLLGTQSSAGRLIAGPKQKKIEIVTLYPEDITRFPWSGHLGDKLVKQLAAQIDTAQSTLLFTNTRSQAEIWHQALIRERPDWLDKIGLHHGSLEREIRQKVEALLDAGALKCVVCTSSMDLGVDFAPVEQVVQLGSPKGVARLMQRAGRSGHRPGATSRIICVPTHSFELAEFAAARDALKRKLIEAKVPLQKPLDVLVQHLVTIGTGGGFDEAALKEEVRTAWAYRDLSDEEWRWALAFVLHGGESLRAYPQFQRLSRNDEARLAVSNKQIERIHRMNIGTISADTAMRVRMQNGKNLGTIEESFISRLSPGDVFTFAGRVLELKRVREMTAYVAPAKRKRGIVPRWQGGRFPLSTHLGNAVRRQMADVGQGRYALKELRELKPLFELQGRWSRIPAADELLIEQTVTREGMHWFIFPFEGRLVHEGLASLFAYRLTRAIPATVQIAANDYGMELLSSSRQPIEAADWERMFSEDNLTDELLACVNETQMARRQFRDIARVAGLIFQGYPGQQKAARQLQASSELFFDVFREYDPDNLLLRQSHREVLEQQLEFKRLAAALNRMRDSRRVMVSSQRLSPLAFPLWAERLRAQHVSSETWAERVKRMADQLERAASQRPSPAKARRMQRSATGR